MAQTLVDLLGETLLVPRHSGCSSTAWGAPDVIGSKLDRLETPPVTWDRDSPSSSDGDDSAGRPALESSSRKDQQQDGASQSDDQRDVDECRLVSKDGVVLDIVSVRDLARRGVVVALYFTTSAAQHNRETAQHLETLSTSRGLRLSQLCSDVSQPCSDVSPSSGREEVVVVTVAGDEACYRRGLLCSSFCAVPYYHHSVRRGLRRKFRVSSLACLVLLDARSVRVLSRPSLETLAGDPEGLKFPWRPRTVGDILQTASLVRGDGEAASYAEFKGGFKALYFAACWCPPCKAFTPELIKTYQRIKENGHSFEIIFVSSDRSLESFKAHHTTMPWPGLEWLCALERRELAAALQVENIPTLVLLGADDSVLTYSGRSHVVRDPQAEDFPWRDESVELLEERHMATLLDRPCFIIFSDTDDSEVLERYRDELLPVAEEYLLHRAPSGPPHGDTLAFFVAPESGVSEYVRAACGVEEAPAQVCIIDVVDNRRFCLPQHTVLSTAALHAFLSRYRRQELEGEVLSELPLLERPPSSHQLLVYPDQPDLTSGGQA